MATPKSKLLIGAPFVAHMADALVSTIADFLEVSGGPEDPRFTALAQSFPVAIRAPVELGQEVSQQDCRRRAESLQKFPRLLWVSAPIACSRTADGRVQLPEPFPPLYTREFLDIVAEAVCRLREGVGCTLLVENVASFFSLEYAQMGAPEFLRNVAERCQCGLSLNLTAVWLESHYRGWNAQEYAARFPLERVTALRVSGTAQDRDLRGPIAAPATLNPELLALAAFVAQHSPSLRAVAYDAVSDASSREPVLNSLQALRKVFA